MLGQKSLSAGLMLDTYTYPPHDIEIDEGDNLKLQVDAPLG